MSDDVRHRTGIAQVSDGYRAFCHPCKFDGPLRDDEADASEDVDRHLNPEEYLNG